MNSALDRVPSPKTGSRSRARGGLLWAALTTLGVLAHAPDARADLTIAKGDTWEFSTNGRVNAFLSYLNGDGYPSKPPLNGMPPAHNLAAGAGLESVQSDKNNHIETLRLRSGFLGNVLGFSGKLKITDNTNATAHFEIWNTIGTSRTKAAANNPDIRQGYVKLEGPWGGLLAGRSLALFMRGAISLDFNYQHGNGLGYPCAADNSDPTCGMVGYGVIFAGFNPQLTYNTPTLAGFQLSVGLFDPVNAPGKYEKTPLPRLEGELDYDADFVLSGVKSNFHAFANGMVQKMEEEGNPARTPRTPYDPTSVTPWGMNVGFWTEIMHARAGFSMFQGRGLGMNNAFENTPAVFDQDMGEDINGVKHDPQAPKPRKFDGYYFVLGLNFQPVMLNVGYGITRVFATDNDFVAAKKNGFDPIKTQQGISAGINYSVGEHLVLALEYFHAKHTWYFGETQNVNVANAGLTVLW
ncbi:MAG TPA: porin [Polyangiaceae bacterium]|nr:porin [Polyangiaceae bacterium]